MQYLVMFRRYNEDDCVPSYMRNDALAHQKQMEAEVNEADADLKFTVLGHMSNLDGAGNTFTYMTTVEYDGDAEKLTDYLQELYDEYGIAGRYIVMGTGENIKPVRPDDKPTFEPPYAWGVADNAEIPHAWVAKGEQKLYHFPVNMAAKAEEIAESLNAELYAEFCKVHRA